jgi:hypothetical protein
VRRAQRAASLRKLSATPRAIEVQIDELVLRGFPRADRYAIGEALSQEIQRLLADAGKQPFLRQSTDRPVLDVGRVALAPNADPAAVGAQVGQAIHTSLNQTDKGKP